jgi:hypothetical protein
VRGGGSRRHRKRGEHRGLLQHPAVAPPEHGGVGGGAGRGQQRDGLPAQLERLVAEQCETGAEQGRRQQPADTAQPPPHIGPPRGDGGAGREQQRGRTEGDAQPAAHADQRPVAARDGDRADEHQHRADVAECLRHHRRPGRGPRARRRRVLGVLGGEDPLRLFRVDQPAVDPPPEVSGQVGAIEAPRR